MNQATKNSLVFDAIPTLFDVPHPPERIKPKRHLPSRTSSPCPKKRRKGTLACFAASPSASQTRQVTGGNHHNTLQDKPPSTADDSPANKLHSNAKDSPTKAKLRKKLSNYRIKVHRLRQKIKKTEQNAKLAKGKRATKAATAKKLADLADSISDYVSGPQFDFIMSQLKNASKISGAKRWTCKDKSFALSLLHSSPKAYRLLRKVLDLPSVKTLKLIMRNISVYPGFNQNILDALQKKLAHGPETSKLVTLVMDEMSIKEGVSYDSGRDLLEGFSETPARDEELANHAIAFMVRGITEKWKQPIGYFLSSGPMSGKAMKELVLQCISKVHSIGLTVMVVISDQGSNNRNLFEKQLGVTTENPYFMHNDSKIFTMYDPPHLVKNVRNNFKKHGFTIDGNDILWQHLRDFYNADSSKAIRMAPKLKKTHVDLPPFSPLRVRLATQVLSHSVASGMAIMSQWGIITEAAAHTADFIEKMDQLFNCFNSMSISSTAKMRHAFSKSSGHVESLKQMLLWVRKIQTKGKRNLPCLAGWEMAINAVLMLWDTLHNDHGLQFLLTNRLNQDCVENLFCIIRAKGAQRDNPDAGQFRAAFRQVMVDSVMVSSKLSNCEADVDRFICSLEHVKAAPISNNNLVSSPQPSILDDLPFSVKSILSVCTLPVQDDNTGLSNQETNVLAYIGGYIVHKIGKKVCSECKEKIVSDLDESNPNHAFIVAKSYKCLLAPSKLLLGTVQLLELKYRKIIKSCIHQQHVKVKLVAELSKVQNLNMLHCKTCHVELLVLHLVINIRLHHSIKEINQGLKDNKTRKNRKTIKFSHL